MALVPAAVGLLVACNPRGPAGVSTIRPAPLTDSGAPTRPSPTEGETEPVPVRPLISVDPSFTVVQTLSVNLDADPAEEQLIAVKRLADVSSPVHLMLAHGANGQGGSSYLSWEGDTLATDTRVFSLSAKDLVGDHSEEVIASGIDDAGKLTLDVYKPVALPGQRLELREIFQLAADEISIEESDRPDAYSAQGAIGPSFPIQVFLRDPESQNALDLISVTYQWSSATDRYVASPAVKVPGEDAQQAQLSTLYHSSGEDAFERFISGSWVQTPAAGGSAQPAALGSVLTFDPVNRQIGIATGSAEEVYVWTESHRTIYKQLRVVGENVTVPLIKLVRRFVITADAPDSITVEISGDDFVETTRTVYTRVNDDLRARLLDHPESRIGTPALTLRGPYASPDGLVATFGDSTLTWSDSAGRRQGSYALFSIGTAIVLTIRTEATDRVPSRTQSWVVTVRESKGPNAVTRTLSLSPVRLTVSGFEPLSGANLVLTQVATSGG